MPPSGDDIAAPTDAELLQKAGAALVDARLDEADGLLARVGSDGRRMPLFWTTSGALAAERGDPAGAAAAMERACVLQRQLYGDDAPWMVVELAKALVAAGRGEAALAARDRAEALILPMLVPGREEMAEELKALAWVDARLAALLWDEGRFDEAIAAQIRLVAGGTEDLPVLRRLRTALATRDRELEALTVQMRIALLQPEAPGPARDMGQLLRALGARAAARAWFRRALALRPEDAAAQAFLEDTPAEDRPADPVLARLARPLEGLGGAPGDAVWPMAVARILVGAINTPPASVGEADWAVLAREAAIGAVRRVLALRTDHAEAAVTLVNLLRQRRDDPEAVPSMRAALKLSPRDAALHTQLGYALQAKGAPAEALRCFRTALSLDPDLPQAMLGLAHASLELGPDQQALRLIDQAWELDPTMPALQARTLRAAGLKAQHRMEEAVSELRQALEIAPQDGQVHFLLGLLLLTLGRLEEGWEHYAWRWRAKRPHAGARVPDDPLRRPDPAAWAGRTVLLYAEQALGDSIQFLRYARMVAEGGARVLLEVPRPLRRLAGSIPDVAGVYAAGDMLPPFDEVVPLLHLPWAFGTTLETIPTTVPYLRGDLTRAAQFRRRLSGLPGLRVGLVWSGDPRPNIPEQALMDARRSVKLKDLAPLARVPGVVFVSLQKGAPAAQAAEPPEGMVLHDWTDELEDFTDTAALMTALDLVISVDTAPAHLAGAVGRQVWLLNRYDTDFRWLLDRDDSPWYPTMRQFRQVRPGGWDEVIERVAAALRERAVRA